MIATFEKTLNMHKHIILFLCLFLPAFTACERVMVLDAKEKPMVVVDYVMTNDPVQTMKLSFTKGASKQEFEYVGDATAFLFDDTRGIQAGEFTKVKDGVWELNYEPEYEHKFSIQVDVPGYETITASQQMAPAVNATALRSCSMIEHHHLIGKGPVSYIVEYPDVDDMWIFGMNYDERLGERVVVENICSDLTNVHSVRTGKVYEGPLYPQLIGQEMYSKVLRFNPREQTPAGYGASGFAINVSGDFVGNFPNPLAPYEYYCRGLVNNGHLISPGEKDGYVVFAIPCKDYGYFLQDVEKFIEIQQSSDMSTIYLRDNIYTNIRGGLGFFGAVSYVKMMWSSDPYDPNDFYHGPKRN